MKVSIKPKALRRIEAASANGSKIATAILAQLKRDVEVNQILPRNVNYIDTKIKYCSERDGCISHRIVFTYCGRDLNNYQFPDKGRKDAMWLPENRSEKSPRNFVEMFHDLNLDDFTEHDYQIFASAICVPDKLTAGIYDTYEDFMWAYLGENYSHICQMGESKTLHNSCMRYPTKARACADFYANLCHNKIIIVSDDNGLVYGRALVWDNVMLFDALDEHGILARYYQAYKEINKLDKVNERTFLDRIYVAFDFVIDMIRNYAFTHNIPLMKYKQDYEYTTQFMSSDGGEMLGIIELIGRKEICNSDAYKGGTPYLDTLYLVIGSDDHDGSLYLYNDCEEQGYKLRSTNGSTRETNVSIDDESGKLVYDSTPSKPNAIFEKMKKLICIE